MKTQVKVSRRIAFTLDQLYAVTVGDDISTWDLSSRSRLLTKHLLDNSSGIAMSPNSKEFILKNTSGVLSRVDLHTLEVLATSDWHTAEGCSPLFTPDPRYFLDADWSGRIELRDAENLSRCASLLLEQTMIQEIRSVYDGEKVAFVVQPRSSDTTPPTYILTTDWTLSAQERIDFDFKTIYAISTDKNSRLWLVVGSAPDVGFCVRLYDLSESQPLFSQPIEVVGSGFACEIIEAWNRFCYTQPRKVAFFDLQTYDPVSELSIEYPCSFSRSVSDRYLGIGSWTDGVILEKLDCT